MKKSSVVAGSAALVCLTAGLGRCTQDAHRLTDEQLVPLIDSSAAVFLGTVVTRGTRTTAAVPASRLTAVVRVTEVAPPESLSLLTAGDLVTLRVSDTTALTENGSYVFLANILSLDTGIVAREVARLDASTRDARVSAMSRVRLARIAAEDARLQRHLQLADEVLLGVVQTVAPAIRDSLIHDRPDEGAPDWQVAEIAVRYQWHGDSIGPGRGVALYFPNSAHVRFAGAPRLRVGDAGVFIAHKGRLARAWRDSTARFLRHLLDVRPLTDSSRVARLMASRAGGRSPAK